MRILFLFLLTALLNFASAIINVAPTWITSPFLKADWKKIITTKTGNSSTPNGTLTFSAPAFTQIPNLGYGISNYEGDDSLYSQMFEVNRTGLTTTSFSVAIQIKGITNIWILEVRYVAIDMAFPHHLNTFDNVPINYTKGALVNISTRSSTVQTYTNTINYTAQTTGLGLKYRNFSLPLTNNKVLCFMTSLFITGVMDSDASPYPVSIVLTSSPTTNQTYTLSVSASKNISITKMHFSMIVFDKNDVQSSGKYQLVHDRIDFTYATGGFYAFPIQSITNFMIGLTDLSSNKTMSAIVFDTEFKVLANGTHGVNKPPQECKNGSYKPVLRYGMTVFYLQTWVCPDDTYYDEVTKNCTQCLIPNCATCLNATACSKCDQVNGYFLNAALLCQACTIVGCINCQVAGVCTDCNQNIGYILNTNTSQCERCDPLANQFVAPNNLSCITCSINKCTLCLSLTQCSVCSSIQSYYVYPNGQCEYCDPSLNNFINSVTLQCEQCTLSNCLTCQSLTQCQVCNQDALYLRNSSNLCQLCTLANCAKCTSFTTCQDCAVGFVINTFDSTCIVCALAGCLNCIDSITCAQCDVSNNYITLPNTQCQQCDTANGSFVNQTLNSCQPCLISNCTTCESLQTCQLCDYAHSYHLLADGTCGYCNNTLDQFINNITLECDHCTIPHCLDCTNLAECFLCDQANKYELNQTDNLCYLCTLEQCLDCGSLEMCLQCNQTAAYFMNYSLNICQLCTIEGCLICQQLDNCSQCDSANNYGPDNTSPNLTLCGHCNVSCTCDGYGMPWIEAQQNCTSICGDGLIRLDEQCDDNNTDDGDGCSSQCVQEEYYNCTGEPSNCTLMLYIQGIGMEAQKEGCNGVKVSIVVDRFRLQQIRSNIIVLNSGVTITNIQEVQAQPSQYKIIIHLQYMVSLVNTPILIHLKPGQILSTPYNPSTPALYYTKQECDSQRQIETMLSAVQIISYVILVTSILSCKIVGLELFGVLQLAYFSLSSHDWTNIYLRPLMQFRTFNGLNVGVFQENSQPILPDNYKEMGISSNFINNCNVMLIVLFSELILSILVYIVGRIIRNTKTQTIGLRLLKQGFITLVLFNILNISFSAGVHWKYSSSQDQNYVVSSAILYGTLLAMVMSVFAMELTSKRDYGEFKNKFKKVWICQLYVPFTIVYRMIIGFYIALKHEYEQGTLIVLAFSLVFLLYVGINTPFTNVYQNYRCGLVHGSMFLILLTTNYYRTMKSNTPLETKARIYVPALVELVLIVCCIGVSFFVLVYEIYQLVRWWRMSKKSHISDEVRKRNNTDESFVTMN